MICGLDECDNICRERSFVKSAYMFSDVSEYDTPANAPKSLLFKLLCGSRLYYYAHIFGVFCRVGMLGKAGKLDAEAQITYSNHNLLSVEACGGKVHIRGLDNLRKVNMQPVVLVGNHMSLLETGCFHSVIRAYVDFAFVVKASLLKVPFFKEILFAIGAIPMTRTNPRDDFKRLMDEGKKILASGRSMIVFPQATRSKDFDREKFNSIGVKLARAAGVPVIPFALKTDFLDNGKILKDMGPVHPERDVWFEFGEPITISGNGKEEQEFIMDFIEGRIAEWRRMEAERDCAK